MGIPSYTKIRQLGHRDTTRIFDGQVVIEEKVDGSQISFGRDGTGKLVMRSHHKPIDVDNPNTMFALAVEIVKSIAEHLPRGYTFRGEYLSRPKHNVLAYDRVPLQNIAIYDIDIGDCLYMAYNAKRALAERLGFECVQLLFIGKVIDIAKLNDLLDVDSMLGGQKIEGFVVKQYSQEDSDGKTLMAKVVSDRFKEVAKSTLNRKANKDAVAEIVSAFATEARWHKAVQHLRERGELDGAPKDIGKLVLEVQHDTLEECEDEIKARLFAAFRKDIVKGLVRGLPQWYKAILLKNVDGYTGEQRQGLEDAR
jgi:hypothetical protein